MDSEALSEETRFVARCAFAGAMGTGLPAPAVPVDTPALEVLATRHQVVNQVLAALLPLSEPASLAGLKRLAAQERLQAMALQQDLCRLDGILGTGGISYLVLKGLPLSAELHGDPFVRPAVDIDVLVDGKDLTLAAGLLLQQGWRLHRPASKLDGRAARLFNWACKDWIVVSPAGRTVELHHRLMEVGWILPETVGNLWAQGRWVTVGQQRFRVLDPAAMLFHLLLHAASSGWQKLKWSLDIALILARADDRTRATWQGLARAAGLARVWDVAVRLVAELYGVHLLEEAGGGRRDPATGRIVGSALRLIEGTSAGRHKGRQATMAKAWHRAMLVPGHRYKIGLGLRRLVGPEFWPDIPLPDWACPAYVLMAPVGRLRRLF